MTADAAPGRPGIHRRLPVRAAVLLVAAAAGLACTSHRSPGSAPETVTAAEQFDTALSARAGGDLASAASGLRAVRDRCSGEPLGDQAFLLLVATGLDPRYRDGAPDSVAAQTARYLARDSTSRWVEALTESLHLVARDLGDISGATGEAAEPGTATGSGDCAARWVPGAAAGAGRGGPPALGGPSLRDRIRALRTTADSLRAEVERLRELLKTSGP